MIFKKEKPVVDWLIVGLGNYTEKYKNTRHNVGFLAVDALREEFPTEPGKSKWQGMIWKCEIEGSKCLLVQPHTFMNNSGDCVARITSYFKIPPERVLVIYDDTALDTGHLRIRKKGTDGGHNGIKSVMHALGSYEVPRIRVGISKPAHDFVLTDWVLGELYASERRKLEEAFPNIAEAVRLTVRGGIEEAMNKFNTAEKKAEN